jgi:hypothetical protein
VKENVGVELAPTHFTTKHLPSSSGRVVGGENLARVECAKTKMGTEPTGCVEARNITFDVVGVNAWREIGE